MVKTVNCLIRICNIQKLSNSLCVNSCKNFLLLLFVWFVTFQKTTSSADLFSKTSVFKTILSRKSSVSNSLDPDQARLFVGPDLGPNCLQMLSADNTGRQRVLGVPVSAEKTRKKKKLFDLIKV